MIDSTKSNRSADLCICSMSEAKPHLDPGLCSFEKNMIIGDDSELTKAKPRLLLHSCCGPCSSSVLERLVGEFEISVFFYNPCITDEEEYKRRRGAQIQFIERFNKELIGLTSLKQSESTKPKDKYQVDFSIKYMEPEKIHFVEGAYEPGAFFAKVRGHENDEEGGARCSICFRQRLEKTAERASILGCEYFGTTLTVSPHKNYKLISEIGREIASKHGLTFLDRDFKKQDGFKRSIELSKKYNLYRQNYCGCEFSKWQD